ncbi:hypothetical protein MSAN_00749600 [Mycena sanguinolenta]|uniref:Uncharacterized protein n=1 Tax=Mycena sanguinolenta TaxID=230812 RepID=A0A8H7DFH2_9AGAR|nr:hypothetical protein MSAN_00749600 [Mycena sanguinolenta]
MTSPQTIPQLPVELIVEIVSTTWHLSLSRDERITFMRSSTLVNSTWADIFDLVSSRDVYIPSSAFCDHFIQRLRRQEPPPATPSHPLVELLLRPFYSPAKRSIQTGRSANLACQSLTIQIANQDRVHPGENSPMRLPMGGVLDSLVEVLDARSLAPNLRRLSIEFLDTGFADIFSRVGLAALPPQITHLDVRYSFSGESNNLIPTPTIATRATFRNIWLDFGETTSRVPREGQSVASDARQSYLASGFCLDAFVVVNFDRRLSHLGPIVVISIGHD